MAGFKSSDMPKDAAKLAAFLKTLTPAQLAEAEQVLNADLDAAQDRKTEDGSADPDLASMTVLVENILALRAETESRAAESDAKAAEVAKLRAAVAPKATTEAEPAEDPAPDADPAPDDDGGDAGEETAVPADVEAVAAGIGKAIVASMAEAFAALPRMANPPKAEIVPAGAPSLNRHLSLGAASQYAPDAQVPGRRGEGSVLVASADIPGMAQGTAIEDSLQLANALHHRARMMGISHTGDPTPVLVASMNRTFKHRLDLDSPMDVIEQVLRDATDVDALIAAGGWCFGAGTLVQTPDGLVPIEDLAVDDMVTTASGNARRVALVLTREAQQYTLKVHGARTAVTAEHPMWARRRRQTAAGNTVQINAPMIFSEPSWIPAGDLKPGDQVAFAVDNLMPGETDAAHSTPFLSGITPDVAEARAYLLGRYLGDGWTSRKRVAKDGRADMYASYICSSHAEGDDLEKAINASEVGYSRREFETVTQFSLSSAFRDWLFYLNAGSSAHDKRIPQAVFGWPANLREAVLAGYVAADGSVKETDGAPRVTTTTVGRELAVSTAMLIRTLGYSPGLVTKTPNPSEIDGRAIKAASASYQLQWTQGEQGKTRFEKSDGVMWESVQSIEPSKIDTVWDITVDDAEHTFIADGMVVHNCAPSEISYDFFNIVCEDGMIDLPSVGVLNRGGFRFPTSPTYADVIAGSPDGLWTWTETDDQSAVTGAPVKDCVRVPCPSFNDVRLACDGFCVTAGNLIDFAYPENVANWIRLVMATRAHVTNSRVISIMQAASTSVVVGLPTGGVYGDLMDAVALSAADYRARFAMCNDAILEVILPTWIVEAVQTDWARRDTATDEVMTRDRLMRGFDARNVRVQFVQDYQVRTTGKPGFSTAQTTFPAQGEFMIYAPGTFVRGQGLQLNLGVVRDSVLNATNDMTAAWAEDCYAVAQVGHLSRKVTFNICVAGTVGARNITC